MIKIPVVIIAYNQFTYIRNMINQCLPITKKIYVIDNASTYKPLIDYYENEIPKLKKVEIIRRSENDGSYVWTNYTHLFPDEYVITDPDLLFNHKMPDNVISILSIIRRRFNADVVGLALDINDHKDFTDAKCAGLSIYDFEIQYWQNKIKHESDDIYVANIATTFALHSKSSLRRFEQFGKCLRIAGRFTCKHIPWYRNDKSPLPISEEERIAYKRNKKSGYWFI